MKKESRNGQLKEGKKKEEEEEMEMALPLTAVKLDPIPDPRSLWLIKVLVTAVVFLLGALVAVLAILLAPTDEGEACECVSPVVMTTKGAVRGVRRLSELGRPLVAFYGIPFARPPVGPLRFQNPMEPEAWRGTRDGNWRPPPCIQMTFIGGNKSLGEDNEDCLYLNVFTPKVGEREKLPVLVFLHGGGYVEGSAGSYQPDVLLNHPIVLVVPQFRIGTLGFLSTEDSAAPGNLMLKDQRVALMWVRDNIVSFGGDPSRVTITGNSAGGSSSDFHILSPMSAGLFSRAILHSGTALSPFALGMKHREVALETALALGCPDTSTSSAIVACLQQAPVDKLKNIPSKYYEWLVIPSVMAPRVDGEFLPESPAVLLKEGRFRGVDIMIGNTAHDGSLCTHVLYRNDRIRQQLVVNFTRYGPISLFLFGNDPEGVTARAIYQHWLGGEVAVNEAASDNITKLMTDYSFGVPSDFTTLFHARHHHHHHHNVYQFEFTYRGQHTSTHFMKPIDVGKHWVTHSDDLLYLFPGGVFHNDIPLKDPRDLRVREIMTKMWVNFVATGNPTPDESLGFKWEAVTEEGCLQHLVIQPDPVMMSDQRAEARDFLASLLPNIDYLHN